MSRTSDSPTSFPDDVVIPSDTTEAQRVQEQIVDELKAVHFGERDIFGIRLALEEALVNAMKHGNQLDPRKKVRIAWRIENEIFYVRIGDEGKGFDPDDVPDPTDLENLERPCGRGLMLMRHYMNDVRFVERGNVVVMWKRRNGTG